VVVEVAEDEGEAAEVAVEESTAAAVIRRL